MPTPVFFIADQGNLTVRKVDASGIITTPSYTSVDPVYIDNGGFNGPWGLCPAPNNGFYVGDESAGVIYLVDSSFVVTRVVGDGFSAGWHPWSGIGGPALSVEPRSSEPYDIASDAAGNLYISSPGDNKIYAVNMQATTQVLLGVSIPSGAIDTVAGTGTAGFSGDGGPATSADIFGPEGMIFDSSGNMFFADQGGASIPAWGQRIRRIDNSTGFITTVAGNGTEGFSGDGGPATSAELKDPLDVKLDAAGNIYIADTPFNYRIRAVNMQATPQTLFGVLIAPGNIDTIAGNGTDGYAGDGGPALSAQIGRGVWSLAFDSTGNLYLCDAFNNIVRMVDQATNSISTVAGTYYVCPCRYTGDGGPATAATICSPYSVAIQSAVPTTGNIVVVKETLPPGDPQIFTFTPSYNQATPFTLTDGHANDSGPLSTGTYSVVESPVAGWETTTDIDPSAIVVSPGTTSTITFTNTKSGRIIIEKVTDPSDSVESFIFTPSYGARFSLMDGQSNDSGFLSPGTYSIVETPVPGWVSTPSQDPSSIVLGAGETITIIFTNTPALPPAPGQGSIVVHDFAVGGRGYEYQYSGITPTIFVRDPSSVVSVKNTQERLRLWATSGDTFNQLEDGSISDNGEVYEADAIQILDLGVAQPLVAGIEFSGDPNIIVTQSRRLDQTLAQVSSLTPETTDNTDPTVGRVRVDIETGQQFMLLRAQLTAHPADGYSLDLNQPVPHVPLEIPGRLYVSRADLGVGRRVGGTAP